MRRYLLLWTICWFLSHATQAFGGPTTPNDVWYPFVEKGKWGFIDAHGQWKIKPAYDVCYVNFVGDWVRAWMGDKWGYIDRAGHWIVRPQFTDPEMDFDSFGVQLVYNGKKCGILRRDGSLILPTKYDAIVLGSDRAWVRLGGKLGMFLYSGQWLNPMKTDWPQNFDTPEPTNSDGVAWFQEISKNTGDENDGVSTGKWGLINSDGHVLLPPRFDPHIPSRHEDPDDPEGRSSRPEGLDFKQGKAEVYEGGKPVVVDASGGVQPESADDHVSSEAWSSDLRLFHTLKDDELRSPDGTVVFKALSIDHLVDGLARYKLSNTEIGIVDDNGKVVIPAGKYLSIGDFSEGVAAAVRQGGNLGFANNRCAGFLDKTGQEIIPFTFWDASSFSGGYAAVTVVIRDQSGAAKELKAGYIDHTGKVIFSPVQDQLTLTTTPFCRDRAWVLKPGAQADFDHAEYAMIDTTGKVLTDYRFRPPEGHTGINAESSSLESKRWRGNLALIESDNISVGLATADGKILFEPQFREIGELQDGMMRFLKWAPTGSGFGYLNEQGEMVIPPIYGSGTSFQNGVAIVTRHDGQMALIDKSGKELRSFYREPFYGGGPVAVNGVLCVADAKGFVLYGVSTRERLRHMSWGYIDLTGRMIAWHNSE